MSESYIDRLLATAAVRETEDGFEATLDLCDGLTVFAMSPESALADLREALGEWIHTRLEDRDPLPVVDGLLDEDE